MLDHRIYTFLTLYEEMNYRKTAERLNMTQPGVTQHIHYLEDHYGVKLFIYDGRTLKRTKNAEILKRHLDSIRAEELEIQKSFLKNEAVTLKVGATKTIGEFVIVSDIRRFLSKKEYNLDFVIDNTEKLLEKIEKTELDFAIIEGVFDKTKYPHHLYKKEKFCGICSANHRFAGKTVSLDELFTESIVVREKGSGTRGLLEEAIKDRGYDLDCFARCSSVSNFSVISELVAKDNVITFAYEPIAHSRDDLATFSVIDMDIKGEFNFVYCNEKIAKPKTELFIGKREY